jgi:tetratricopeptide (TPR) repeat protein
MSAKITQVLLVAGALILSVLLFFVAPKHPSAEDGSRMPMAERGLQPVKADNNARLEVYLNLALKNLEPSLKKNMDELIAAKQNDSLSEFWAKARRYDLASVYEEKKAEKQNTAEGWYNAGNRYYSSVQFTQDKTEVPLLYQCAMRCFSKALKLDPKNTDARIMLASCYVEGTQNPMEGISMLKEVEKTDSNNVKLQLSFAFFSVKSGQLDKAVYRFNKALQADSTYIEAYLHLADAYEQQGNTVKTLEMLEKYSRKTPDPNEKAEINKYIQQLKLAGK